MENPTILSPKDDDNSLFRQSSLLKRQASPRVQSDPAREVFSTYPRMPNQASSQSKNEKTARGSNSEKMKSATSEPRLSLPPDGMFAMDDEDFESPEDDEENEARSVEGEEGDDRGLELYSPKYDINARPTDPRMAPVPLRHVNHNPRGFVAMSLPINITGEKLMSRASLEPVSDDEDELKDCTGSIADKMKIVARSYLYDNYSESIFGDLPSRPRM